MRVTLGTSSERPDGLGRQSFLIAGALGFAGLTLADPSRRSRYLLDGGQALPELV